MFGGFSLNRRQTKYELVITASNLKASRISLALISWEIGLITGSRKGVSMVPRFVRSRPILPSRSLLRISNDNLLSQALVVVLSS